MWENHFRMYINIATGTNTCSIQETRIPEISNSYLHYSLTMNLKVTVFAFIFLFGIFNAVADISDGEYTEGGAALIRNKRLTCDVFNSKAMCHAHCKLTSRKGGSCVNGFCHCRN